MSRLFETFIQRQDSCRSRSSIATTATVASYAVEDQFDPEYEYSENPKIDSNENSFKKDAVNAYFDSCQNVKVGDEVNNVHNHFNTSKNAQKFKDNKCFDDAIKTFLPTDNKKFLPRKWILGLLLLFAIVCIVPTVIVNMMSPKNQVSNYFEITLIGRDDWNASSPESGLKNLTTPIQRVIVTYTEDEPESCKTRVRFSKHFKFKL